MEKSKSQNNHINQKKVCLPHRKTENSKLLHKISLNSFSLLSHLRISLIYSYHCSSQYRRVSENFMIDMWIKYDYEIVAFAIEVCKSEHIIQLEYLKI